MHRLSLCAVLFITTTVLAADPAGFKRAQFAPDAPDDLKKAFDALAEERLALLPKLEDNLKRVTKGLEDAKAAKYPNAKAKEKAIKDATAFVEQAEAALSKVKEDVFNIPRIETELKVGLVGYPGTAPAKVTQILDKNAAVAEIRYLVSKGDRLAFAKRDVVLAIPTKDLADGSEIPMDRPLWIKGTRKEGATTYFVAVPLDLDKVSKPK